VSSSWGSISTDGAIVGGNVAGARVYEGVSKRGETVRGTWPFGRSARILA